MPNPRRLWPAFALLACNLSTAQPGPAGALFDPELRAQIERIPAIDNHTHILPVPKDLTLRWNAAKPLGEPPYPMMVRLRVDNPEWMRAWRALYGYPHADMSAEHAADALRAKQALLERTRADYVNTILDRANVAIALVNADALGEGQRAPRVRWVPYLDPLMQLASRPDGADPKGVLTYAGATALPSTPDAYVSSVIVPTIARWKREAVPAAKVTAAYWRSLDFQPVSADQASRAWSMLRAGGPAEGRILAARTVEDFILFAAVREAGKAGIAIHVHTGNGVGPWFDNARANPLLLEPLLNAKESRETRFVLIHGGWPFGQYTAALLDKPNTFADFSVHTFLFPAPRVAQTLREWLELMPEKVLFGSDAYSDENTPLADWEEKTWLMTATARDALAIALTGMMRDGLIDPQTALEMARGVMHDNAARLYGLWNETAR